MKNYEPCSSCFVIHQEFLWGIWIYIKKNFPVLRKETPKLQLFSQQLAALPPTQLFFLSPTYFFHNRVIWHDWFPLGIVPLSAAISVLYLLQRTIQVFAGCSGSRWGTWLSAEFHTTAMVMVGVGSCNGSAVTYGGLPHWVVEIFNTSACWQYFCLSY